MLQSTTQAKERHCQSAYPPAQPHHQAFEYDDIHQEHHGLHKQVLQYQHQAPQFSHALPQYHQYKQFAVVTHQQDLCHDKQANVKSSQL